MGDRDHVELFLKGVGAWNGGGDPYGAGSEDHVTWVPASDLSGEPVGYRVSNSAWREGTSIEQATDYRGINLDPFKLGRVSIPVANRRTSKGVQLQQCDIQIC